MSDQARLILIAPPALGDGVSLLGDALAGGSVSAVIQRLPELDERALIKLLKPLVPVAQGADAAFLLAGHPEIVARVGADGAHIDDPRDLSSAIQLLRPHQRIIGAGGLRARHDAMEAAERDCDYVLFGEPDSTGEAPPFTAVLERAQWWAEVFQTPCVAYASALDQIEALAATGCEFIALGEAVFAHAGGPGQAVASALAMIEAATPALAR